MDMLMTLLAALLFFLLTPGILVTLPTKGSKVTVALVHAVIFALIYYLTYKVVWKIFYEGFVTCPKGQIYHRLVNKCIPPVGKGANCDKNEVCQSKKCDTIRRKCI
jgi:hypothetical protein